MVGLCPNLSKSTGTVRHHSPPLRLKWGKLQHCESVAHGTHRSIEPSVKVVEEASGYNSNDVKRTKLQATLTSLLDDPVLADVPKKPTLSDVETLISLELGSAMRISVLKLDGTSFDVVVMNSANVKDLKLAVKKKVKKKVNEMEQSKMGHRQISWKHVWANYCLSYHNQKLIDDNSALQDLGIRNHSQVQFLPYVATKESRRHSKRRRKHRFFHGLNKRG
ncbi:U11/U12 small nuclear ribonucleoprotein 25 kDa protein-like [Tripterygium wilfordii]|uniref:U11/U12 small nuclear ribonucleoprotein 25 kDa protein-like n=1 Tax=Tripterygium wilfordii TaxID=458696 RepID=UPI0018F83292|nr:U11/U12 small nuclear ribonucleoprotein 25 kDa protein-like [Tripterygium wilfordii]